MSDYEVKADGEWIVSGKTPTQAQLDRIEAKLNKLLTPLEPVMRIEVVPEPSVAQPVLDAIASIIGAWQGDMEPVMGEMYLVSKWLYLQHKQQQEGQNG